MSDDNQLGDNKVDGADRSLHQLPSGTVKLLTSAQVITSVVSVVKEVVENSLDAGATVIDVRLVIIRREAGDHPGYRIGFCGRHHFVPDEENYGFDRIEIRDNGCGIAPVDTPFMARPHYTSKISSSQDLESLETYGFRGEALGALCAVSDLTITTKTALDDFSQTYSLSTAGLVTSVKPSHLGQGTTVIACHLFKNIPVRRNFYKADKKKREELKKVEDLLAAFGIICHGVRITLRHGRDLVWQKCATQSTRDALLQALGRHVISNMVHCQRQDQETRVEIEAYLPKPSTESHLTSRTSNERSFVFVNNRPVFLKEIEKHLLALIKGLVPNLRGLPERPTNPEMKYQDKLIREHYCNSVRCDRSRYPIMFLKIALPPHGLDVNLDPNKTRVFLHDQKEILNMLRDILEEVYGSLGSTCHQGESKKSKTSNSQDLSDERSVKQTPCNQNNTCDVDSTAGSAVIEDLVPDSCLLNGSKALNNNEINQSDVAQGGVKVIFEEPMFVSKTGDEHDEQLSNANILVSSTVLKTNPPSFEKLNVPSKPSFTEFVTSTQKSESKESVSEFGLRDSDVATQAPCFDLLDDDDLLFAETQPVTGHMSNSCDMPLEIDSDITGTLKNDQTPEKKEETNLVTECMIEKDFTSHQTHRDVYVSEDHSGSISGTMVTSVSESVPPSSIEASTCTLMKADSNSDQTQFKDKMSGLQLTNVDHAQSVCRTTFITNSSGKKTRHSSDHMADASLTETGNSLTDTGNCNTLGWSKGIALTSTEGRAAEPVKLLVPGTHNKHKETEEIMPQTSYNTTYTGCLQSTPKISKLKSAASSPGQTTLYDLVHNQPVKRSTTGYVVFCQEVKMKVLAENPDSNIARIGEILRKKWEELTPDQRQNYEHLALKPRSKRRTLSNSGGNGAPQRLQLSSAAGSSILLESPLISRDRKQITKKRKLNTGPATSFHSEENSTPSDPSGKVVPFDMKKLKSVTLSGPNDCDKSASAHHLIGLLKSHNVWFSFHENQIVLILPTRIQEMLIYLRLLGNHSLSTDNLDTPINLQSSLIGEERWTTLLSMQKSQFQLPDPHTYYNDPRLVKNGFNIREITDQDSGEIKVQVCGMTHIMNYFGLVDLREILDIISVSARATLSESRPIKIRHYLQGEAVRMARQLPQLHDRDDVLDILKQAERHLPPGCTMCFHNKPFSLPLYDFADLPLSQGMEDYSLTQNTQE